MNLEEMKRCKKEKGYTYVKMSELSGVPLGTIQKIFNGETESPRYDTLKALEDIFMEPDQVREAAYAYDVDRQGSYTIEDYYQIPDEQRVELIDGYFYDMTAPVPLHQLIAGEVHRQIANFILDEGGDCIPFISPIDVQLDCDEKTMVQPDVIILCDRDKMNNKNIYGAPEFVMEVLSPSTRRKDCLKKLDKYENAGVKEYWIVDPDKKKLLAYFFEEDLMPTIYGLEGEVPLKLYGGKLSIRMEHIAKWVAEREKSVETQD
ncbi:MAG: Uma2 family endonuclease [Lachnospiraceae bacterium]|nr:Uma2 family endonuclease [Lachnospiraceae bacterium]